MHLKSLMTGSVAVLAAATVATTLSAAGDARPPRIVAAVMQDADGDGHGDRVGLVYSERVRHDADRDGKYPFVVAGYKVRAVGAASGNTVVLTLVEKAAVDDAARPSVRYGRTKRGIDPRPGKESGSGTGVPGDSSAREPTARDPAALAASESRLPAIATETASSTRRTAHRRIRRSGPERRMRRTSRSSTRTATASTETRRERSSRHRWARTRTRARRQRPSARSRQPSSRPRSPRRMSTRRQASTAGSRRPVASASSAATTPRPGSARSYRSHRSSARRKAIYAAGATGVVLQHLTVRGQSRRREPAPARTASGS